MSRPVSVIGGAALGAAITLVAVAGTSVLRGAGTDGQSHPATGHGARVLSGADAAALGCQPHEAALIHRVTTMDEPIVAARCVTISAASDAALAPSAVTESFEGSPLATSYAPVAPLAAPASQPAAQAVSAPPPVVQAAAPTPVRQTASASRGRSWQKTAMVIGGSTAAGAGVGGLVGGKRGALVGAAIGGGASTIYESAKR